MKIAENITSSRKSLRIRTVMVFCLLWASALSAQDLQSFESSSGLYGYKDKKGQIRIQPRFQYAGDFNRSGFASVIEGGKPYYIDQKGKHIFQMYFFDNGPDDFQEGLARFVENGKMGFFDERGTRVIPAVFDFVFPFSGGTAEACNGCKKQAMGEHFTMEGGVWLILDKHGKTRPHPRKGQ